MKIAVLMWCDSETTKRYGNTSYHINKIYCDKHGYDLIFSSGVFHHIPHQEHGSIINHLSRLLNQNGKIVIWEHNPINPITLKIVKECPFDKDAVLIRSNKLRQHLEAASLEKVQIIYTTFFPKILSRLNAFDSFLSWLPLGGQYLAIAEKKIIS